MQSHPKPWKFLLSGLFILSIFALVSNRSTYAQSSLAEVQSPDQIEIVGGQNANAGEYPWQVQVWRSTSFCGGSLIAPNWVLTAAHCMGSTTYGMSVVLGAHEYNNAADPWRQVRAVKRRIVHPLYNRTTLDNDIALVELTMPATINERVQTIPYAVSSTDSALFAPNVVSVVTGWGKTSSISGLAAVLQEVSQPIVEAAVCQTVYGNWSNNMICAGYPEGAKSTCQGDSGGPLVVADGLGGWKQAGIVSFGMLPCASAGAYAGFTKVGNYDSWIQSYLNPPPPTPTPTPVPMDDVIKNGDFEQGADQWQVQSVEYSSPLVESFGAITAESGSTFVRQGGSIKHFDEMSQTITLPVVPTFYLNFSYQIQSNETNCYYDSAKLYFDRSIVKSIRLCSSLNTGEWKRMSIKLGVRYSGKTLPIKIRTTTNLNNASHFLIDNVWLSSAPPAFSSDVEMVDADDFFEDVFEDDAQQSDDNADATRRIFLPAINRN